MPNDSVLQRWNLSDEELTTIIDENPSLKGFLFGYVAEFKLRALFRNNPLVTEIIKSDDHDRRRKNDLTLLYKGRLFSVEVKSLQTQSIRRDLVTGQMSGVAQVDASDKRQVTLPDGSKIATTCLLRGEFDLLAINLFQFRQRWEFAFILNRDLPSSRFRSYTPFQQQMLLATTIRVTLPLTPPFHEEPFVLLDSILI
jgi:hypothetical protein